MGTGAAGSYEPPASALRFAPVELKTVARHALAAAPEVESAKADFV
jgi:hypothetical protein